MGINHKARPAAATVASFPGDATAWAGDGVSSSMRAGSWGAPAAGARRAGAGAKRRPARPTRAAPAITTGKGTEKRGERGEGGRRVAHVEGTTMALDPMRIVAAATMATTAGFTPERMAAITGLWPKARYAQDSPMRIATEGSTKSVPATTAPRVPCSSQPM